jgi:CRP/FNR family transcriptional regulator, polysaccharide utilization system transcription regulator
MAKKKILIIEDNPEVRENTAEILELSEYQVVTAPNGKAGVDLARSEKPDLIICDIMMPELDGYGVLHILGKAEDTATIPFIFLTAKAEKTDFRKGMMLGADDYLTKPFDDLELLNVVEMRLAKSEKLKKDFGKGVQGFQEFVDSAKVFSDWMTVADKRNIRNYRKKEEIYHAGQYPMGAYLVSKGVVKTSVTNEDGKELITGVHKEGDFIGFIALLEDKPFAESAIAMEDAELILIPKKEFQEMIFNNREVSRKFIQLLSGNVLEKEHQLLKLAYNSVRKRVAEALSVLHDRYKKDGEEVKFSISREDLANMVGTATESAIRTLADFKEEGLIEIQKGDIRILNIEKLKKLKN